MEEERKFRVINENSKLFGEIGTTRFVVPPFIFLNFHSLGKIGLCFSESELEEITHER